MEVVKTPANAPFTMVAITAAIEAMKRSQATSARSIGRVLVMAAFAANAGVEGKPSADVANALFANLRKGVKKTQLVSILEEHCNLAYISGAFVPFDAKKDWSEQSARDFKVLAAEWETYKAAPPPKKDLDVAGELDALVQRLIRAAVEKRTTHGDYLERIVQLNATIKGELMDAELVGEVTESQQAPVAA